MQAFISDTSPASGTLRWRSTSTWKQWHPLDRLEQDRKMLDEAIFSIKTSYAPVARSCLSQPRAGKRHCGSEATRLNMPYVTERWLGGMSYQFCYDPQVVEKTFSDRQDDERWSYENYKKENSCWRARKPSCKAIGWIADLTDYCSSFRDWCKARTYRSGRTQSWISRICYGDTNSDPSNIDSLFPPMTMPSSQSRSLLITLAKPSKRLWWNARKTRKKPVRKKKKRRSARLTRP